MTAWLLLTLPGWAAGTLTLWRATRPAGGRHASHGRHGT